jgi:cytochrome P450
VAAMKAFRPPTVEPPDRILGILGSLRAARRNVLSILPGISFRQPILSGRTGPARWHMVQGPEGLKRVFLDNVDNYPKSEVMIRMLRSAVGDSLFTSEGPAWRWQRRAIAPVFSSRNVRALAPLMTGTAERAVARVAAQEGPVELVREMLSATFDVICEVALSGREHFDSEAYLAAVTRYYLTIGRASLLDFLDAPRWVPRPGEILGRGAVRTANRMVAAAIAARRREATGRADDLLDYMMKAEDPETGRRMDETDLLHNMQFFIVAGHETTALTLAWALLMIAHDEAVQERAAAEAVAAVGDRAATVDTIEKAPYIDQVLQETLRLYPPVGFLARNVLAPDRLYDRDIRPKETVFLNIYALHRHQNYWDAPDHFDPEHFAPERAAERDRYLHLPFGAGPRICVGANFAMLQARIILTTLLARFRFRPGGPLPEPVMHMTIRPEPGVLLNVEERRS